MITLGLICIVLGLVIGTKLGHPDLTTHNRWDNLASVLLLFGAVSFLAKVIYLAFSHLP